MWSTLGRVTLLRVEARALLFEVLLVCLSPWPLNRGYYVCVQGARAAGSHSWKGWRIQLLKKNLANLWTVTSHQWLKCWFTFPQFSRRLMHSFIFITWQGQILGFYFKKRNKTDNTSLWGTEAIRPLKQGTWVTWAEGVVPAPGSSLLSSGWGRPGEGWPARLGQAFLKVEWRRLWVPVTSFFPFLRLFVFIFGFVGSLLLLAISVVVASGPLVAVASLVVGLEP